MDEEKNLPEENVGNPEDDVTEFEITEISQEGEKKNSVGVEIFEWVQAIVTAFVIAMFLRTFIVTMVYVDGRSMEPTLHNAERMVVTRLSNDKLTNGDVVIFRPQYSPKTPYVKRIIGVPGQTVSFDFDSGKVLVDGQEIDEPYIMDYIAPERFGSFNPYGKTSVEVPEDCFFVLGDNRNNSKDSRYDEVGLVSRDTIIGKAVCRIWPLNKIGDDFKVEKFK